MTMPEEIIGIRIFYRDPFGNDRMADYYGASREQIMDRFWQGRYKDFWTILKMESLGSYHTSASQRRRQGMCDMNQEEPASAEEFARRHPGMAGAMREAVRKELEAARANGSRLAAAQRPLDVCQVVSDPSLVEGDSLDRISQRSDCPVGVTQRCAGLRLFGGIDRLPSAHMVTSLLVVGATIIASAALAAAVVSRGEGRE